MSMPCPECGSEAGRLVGVRNTRDGRARYRRRCCNDCGARWSTYEIPEAEYRAWGGVRLALRRLRGVLLAAARWVDT